MQLVRNSYKFKMMAAGKVQQNHKFCNFGMILVVMTICFLFAFMLIYEYNVHNSWHGFLALTFFQQQKAVEA